MDGCLLTKSSHGTSLVCGVRGEHERKEERDHSLVSLKAVGPNFFGTRDRFSGRQFFHGNRGDSSALHLLCTLLLLHCAI